MIHPDLDGWQIETQSFDYGQFIGVAASKDGKRYAVKAPPGMMREIMELLRGKINQEVLCDA